MIAAIAGFWTFVGNGSTLIDAIGEYFGRSASDSIIAVTGLIVLALLVLLAWGLYAATRSALRRLPVVPGRGLAAVVVVCALTDVILGRAGATEDMVGAVRDAVMIASVCVLFIALGGAALTSWAARLAVRNLFALGHMATIALPVILMLVLFSFFAAEIWQMGTLLTWRSLLLLSLVVATLCTLVVLRVSALELKAGATALTIDERVALLQGTPAEARADAVDAPSASLGATQRINMLFAIALAQLVQAAFFVLLVAVLLIVIGAITVPPSLVQTWIGGGENPPKLLVEPVVIQGMHPPLTTNLLKSAALLAVISALPFVFSAVSEHRYREAFFEPIVADMRRAILVRAVLFRTRRATTPAAVGDTAESGPPASC